MVNGRQGGQVYSSAETVGRIQFNASSTESRIGGHSSVMLSVPSNGHMSSESADAVLCLTEEDLMGTSSGMASTSPGRLHLKAIAINLASFNLSPLRRALVDRRLCVFTGARCLIVELVRYLALKLALSDLRDSVLSCSYIIEEAWRCLLRLPRMYHELIGRMVSSVVGEERSGPLLDYDLLASSSMRQYLPRYKRTVAAYRSLFGEPVELFWNSPLVVITRLETPVQESFHLQMGDFYGQSAARPVASLRRIASILCAFDFRYVRMHLCTFEGMVDGSAEACILEFARFLTLHVMLHFQMNQRAVPSPAVRTVWKVVQLFPSAYYTLCCSLLGQRDMLIDESDVVWTAVEEKGWYEFTLKLYASTFGPCVRQELWPPHGSYTDEYIRLRVAGDSQGLAVLHLRRDGDCRSIAEAYSERVKLAPELLRFAVNGVPVSMDATPITARFSGYETIQATLYSAPIPSNSTSAPIPPNTPIPPNGSISIKLQTAGNKLVALTVPLTRRMGALKDVRATKHGVDVSRVRFRLSGIEIDAGASPLSLGMRNGDLVVETVDGYLAKDREQSKALPSARSTSEEGSSLRRVVGDVDDVWRHSETELRVAEVMCSKVEAPLLSDTHGTLGHGGPSYGRESDGRAADLESSSATSSSASSSQLTFFDESGNAVKYAVSSELRSMGPLFEDYAAKRGISASTCRFTSRGKEVQWTDAPGVLIANGYTDILVSPDVAKKRKLSTSSL